MKHFLWLYRGVFAFFLIIAIVVLASHALHPPSKVKEVTKEQLADAQKLSKLINVSPQASKQITKEIVKVEKPVEVYYATNTQTIKKHEENHLTDNKADRVILSQSSDAKKVEVYRLTLKKEHKFKAGVTIEDRKVYPAIGYQAGRFEGIATMNGNHVKSATVMYTVTEW